MSESAAEYADAMSKLRLVAVGATALLLAACGPVNPGSAAVVEGTRISMTDADDLADTYCTVTLIDGQQSGTTEADNAALRRQAVADLVAGAIADTIAKQRDYSVNVPELSAADQTQIEQLFGDDTPAVLDLVERNQRTNAIATQMAKDAGSTATDADSLLQAGHSLLSEATSDLDITVDPRFGMSETLQQIGETGSLSVPEVSLSDTAAEDRPQALKCTK